jgi:hypothetical protein
MQLSDVPGATWTPVATVMTSRSGEFSYLASPGEARTIRFRYPGTNTIRPANADVPLRVAALTTFHVNRHALRNGQTAHFSGQLQGGAVPAGGKLVELQVRLHRHWQTFATARSDPGGHWRFDYSFGATAGHVTYVFRAVVPPEATYPYDGGASHGAKVTVRG